MSQPSSSGSGNSGSGSKGFVAPSVGDLDAVLDAYEFIEILGQGGMGAVYKARQRNLDRMVAIKILPRFDEESNEQFRYAERFQREARTMARLAHPNIISVFDFGQTSDGQLYIVMEYVDGTDLHQLIRTGELTPEHIFGWMPQICEALQTAHAAGIIHRDIKPANIMINREGLVKVADFGLAKLGGPDSQSTRLTMTNVAMGTPDYVAPEALEDDMEPDHRADLYAVGVMLYEMLTGKIPRGAWRPPSALKTGLDPRFDALVLKAMDADRDTRFQHASEISTQLNSISTTPYTEQVATPGGRKLNLTTGGETNPVRASSRTSSGNSGSTASEEIPSRHQSKKSHTGLIVGGSVAACLAVAGVVSFLVFGSGDKGEDSSLAHLKEDLPTTTTTSPASTPEKIPEPKPEPQKVATVSKSSPKTEPSPGPSPSPDPKPKPNPTQATAPVMEPESSGDAPSLIPRPMALHLPNSDIRYRVGSLKYPRNEPWTFEIWITPAESASMTTVASIDGVTFCQNQEPNPAFWHIGGVPIDGGPVTWGKRAHVAWQNDGESLRIFLDGVPQESQPNPWKDPFRGDPFVLGGVIGDYDEVRFSSVARYSGGFTPARMQPDKDTLAFWDFEESGQEEVARDRSGNGHDIRLDAHSGWVRRDAPGPPVAKVPFDAAAARRLQAQWAEFYGVPVTYENGIGMRLQLIPPGHYQAGPENDREEEISYPYYLGVYEVTQAEYLEIMGDNPSNFQESGKNANQVTGLDTRTHPVETINLLQAAAFCNALSEREGLAPAYRIESDSFEGLEGNGGYRIPTRAEWEYACRAGTQTLYLDGNSEFDPASMKRYARSGDRTYPAGEKLPNQFGLHDIQGNVCEWINDSMNWKKMTPFYHFGSFRGDPAVALSSAKHNSSEWKYTSYDLGFRVILPGLAAVARMPEDREIKRVTPPHPAAEKLAQLETKIRAAYSDKVETSYQASLQNLNHQFRNALTQRAAGAQGQAKAAFQAELDRIENDEPLPATDDGLPPAIVQLRQTWRQQESGFAETRRSATESFWNTEAARLAQVENAFEEEGMTFFALQAREMSRRLQIEFLGEAPAAVVAPSALTSQGSPTTPPLDQDARWLPLFDTRSLDGWIVTGSSKSFSIDGDAIKVSGEPAFLYYSGEVFHGARFRDFDFRAQVKTEGGANSSVFFHTRNAAAGYPSTGYEVQVHNGTQEPGKTGSLTGVSLVSEAPAKEGEWFDLEISVRDRKIITRVNGETLLNHEQPADWRPPPEYPNRIIHEGTFALKCHFPEEGTAWYRNIEVRPYRDALTMEVSSPKGTSIARKRPDPSSQPKGRLNGFGVNGDGTPFTLGELDRGNDYVDVEIQENNWTAIRSRGGVVSPANYWKSLESANVAKISFGNTGGDTILDQDGALHGLGQEPVSVPGLGQKVFVDVGSGYNNFSGLAENGQIRFSPGPQYTHRLPPLGPTDIVNIDQWGTTLWCLRANGKVTWCGNKPAYGIPLPADLDQYRIVDIEADGAGLTLALSDEGKLFVWTARDISTPMEAPAEALSDVTRMVPGWGGNTAAVRKKNGKWIAWGSDKFGVVSKINSLGPEVVEMAFTESKLIWIE